MSDCIIWKGARSAAGYGQFRANGRVVYAHRAAYEKVHGSIPGDLELDHLCRNRACYNPDHLEAVTHQENMARSGPFRRQTVCQRGHFLEGDNVRVFANGTRRCQACRRQRDSYLGKGNDAYSQRTHCPFGHEYTPENTYVSPRGSRNCRACKRARSKGLVPA